MPIHPGDQIGPFIVEKALPNKGGSSKVFVAVDAESRSYRAAIKVALTKDENSQVYQDLLRRETVFLNKLRHPGIVRIYPLSAGRYTTFTARALTHPDRPWYYAMEYLRYGNLSELATIIAAKYPLLWTIELFYQLVTTIHFLHQQRYAHCDLKPQNILFRHALDPHQMPPVVLVDFGSVAPNFQIEQLTASVRYSPPEVLLALRRSDLDFAKVDIQADKVDIWGLGVILFELITGRPLYNQTDRDSITTTILRREIELMGRHRRGVDQSLDFLLTKMLEKEPDKRPTTEQIIEALEERIQSIRPPRI